MGDNTPAALVLFPPVDILGPIVLAALGHMLETGVVLDQLAQYCTRSWDDARGVERALVLFVTAVGTFQTVTEIIDLWDATIKDFGSMVPPALPWWDCISPVVTVAMSCPVQLYMTWRVVKVWKWRWWTIVPLLAAQMTSLSTAFVQTTFFFTKNASSATSSNPSASTPFWQFIGPFFVASNSALSVADVLSSGLLLAFILRTQPEMKSKRMRRTLKLLMFSIWQAAVPPAVFATAATITYLCEGATSTWDIFLVSMVGKLHVIALLVTLNTRASIGRSEYERDRMVDFGSIGVAASTHFHVVSRPAPDGDGEGRVVHVVQHKEEVEKEINVTHTV